MRYSNPFQDVDLLYKYGTRATNGLR